MANVATMPERIYYDFMVLTAVTGDPVKIKLHQWE